MGTKKIQASNRKRAGPVVDLAWCNGQSVHTKSGNNLKLHLSKLTTRQIALDPIW